MSMLPRDAHKLLDKTSRIKSPSELAIEARGEVEKLILDWWNRRQPSTNQRIVSLGMWDYDAHPESPGIVGVRLSYIGFTEWVNGQHTSWELSCFHSFDDKDAQLALYWAERFILYRVVAGWGDLWGIQDFNVEDAQVALYKVLYPEDAEPEYPK